MIFLIIVKCYNKIKMSKVEHGLAGRLAGRLPIGIRVTRGVVKEVLPIEGFDGKELAFLSTTREERAVVLYQDVKNLDIKPGDGVEGRWFPFGEALRPADYLEKKEEGVGEERKEKKLMPGGEVALD